MVRTSPKGKKAVAKLDERYHALAESIEKRLGSKDTVTLVRLLALITPLHEL